ncbi:MAG: PAS domain S-box protein [Chlorobiaceae bacterium]
MESIDNSPLLNDFELLQEKKSALAEEVRELRKKNALLESAVALQPSFEFVVTALSNQFINLPYEQIDSMVNHALQLIGEFVAADRSYIYQFQDGLSLIRNTHEWCREGITPHIGNQAELSVSTLPWWIKQIQNNQVINLSRISKIPDEAVAEKKMFAARETKSLIVVPLIEGPRLFGYIGFDAVRQEQEWSQPTASLLKLAGGIVANALQRKAAEQFIQAELELAIKLNSSRSMGETLKSCLHAAIQISDLDCGGIYLVNHQEKAITLEFHNGLPPEFVMNASSYPLDSPNARIIMKGDPVYSNYSILGIEERECVISEHLQAIAIIPISCRGEVIACMNVASHSLARVPDFARKGLESITAHIGAAIMQSRREEETAAVKNNLESLFDTIDDFIFIVNMEGMVIHTNAVVRNRLGYAHDVICSRHVLFFHPEERRAEAKENIEGMIAGSADVCLVPLLTSSGTLIPVETKITRGLWNNQPALFGICRDISERMKAEEALTESERRFRQLTELLPLPLFETDAEGNVTYSNRKGVEVFGPDTEEKGSTHSFMRFCLPEEAAKVEAHLCAMKTGDWLPKGYEYTAVRKDGGRFPALFYSLPIMHNGSFHGIRSIVVDLSELKTAEEALRNSAMQERIVREFKTLIDNIPGAVYRTDRNGKTVLLSMMHDIMQEYSRDEFATALFKTGAIIHPDDRAAVLASTRQLQKEKTSQTIAYRIAMKSGLYRWFEDRKTSTFSAGGIYTGTDGILFDITERVRAQEAKQNLESNLRKTQRLETIGTLAGGIAHDFNNILTPILGYAEMGTSSLTEEDPLHDYFNEIMLAAERAQNLVSQILTFSRAQESMPAIVNVQAIVSEALKLLRPSIPSTITIEQQIEGNCRNILADPSQIHQVIINLCTNAFQAMESSGGVMTITLRESSPESTSRKQHPDLQGKEFLELSISDTGTGMDETTMERIFEPFFTTKTVNKGTGLGLSVVHGIITSFRGEITVESRLGEGSTFRVYLPVINDDMLTAPAAEIPEAGNGSILLVDDEPATLRMMEVMITRLGFTVHSTGSSLGALELFSSNPEEFDLVITDLTMPEMTGIELAGELHKKRPQLPVILMTGYGKDIEHTLPLSHYGICKFLKKPVKLTSMAATIKEVLSSNKLNH